MTGDEGTTVTTQSVPSIGGDAMIVSGGHVGDEFRANGVNYTENPGVDLDTGAYPAGTVMTDSTPTDNVN